MHQRLTPGAVVVGPPRGGGRRHWPLWLLLAAGLALLALITPHSNDEDQYVAAARLARDHRLYADFLYLQTPLQPLLLRHLIGLWPGHDFVTLRLANAALALAGLAAVAAALRRLAVPPRAALVAVLGLAGCALLQFGAAVARNDALPFALLAAACAVLAAPQRPRDWALAGLLLGLAGCAKIIFLMPGGVLGLWLLWRAARGEIGWRVPLAVAAGALAGLAPLAAAAVMAPQPFLYGVWEAAARDTPYWYQRNGLDWLAGWPRKALVAPWYLAQGPALLALLLVLVRRRALPDAAAPLWPLLIGGLIGGLLPTPLWRQYLIAALPPLFVLLGVALAGLRPVPQRRAAAAVLLLALAATLASLATGLADWARRGSPSALATSAEARWAGERLRAAGWRSGTVATLSPARLLDSGFALDPRFATGSNVFHIADRHSAARLAQLHAIGPATLADGFAAAPPVAVLTGYERRGGNNRRIDPDAALDAWAAAAGYVPLPSPHGKALLWVRPHPRATVLPAR